MKSTALAGSKTALLIACLSFGLSGCVEVSVGNKPAARASSRSTSATPEGDEAPSTTTSSAVTSPGVSSRVAKRSNGRRSDGATPSTLHAQVLDEAMGCGFKRYPGGFSVPTHMSSGNTFDEYFTLQSKVIEQYEKFKDGDVGARLPADTYVVALRSIMMSMGNVHGRDAHGYQTNFDENDPHYQQALDAFHAAMAKVKDLPTDLISREAAVVDFRGNDFCEVASASSALVDLVHAGAWGGLDDASKKVADATAHYEARLGHESPRSRALAQEADATKTKYAAVAKAHEAALNALRRDPTYQRLDAEKSSVEAQTSELRDRLGLGGYDDGCDKHSADPPTQARLTKLCPLARREVVLTKQLYQMIERTQTAFAKRFPSPEQKKSESKARGGT